MDSRKQLKVIAHIAYVMWVFLYAGPELVSYADTLSVVVGVIAVLSTLWSIRYVNDAVFEEANHIIDRLSYGDSGRVQPGTRRKRGGESSPAGDEQGGGH